MAADRLSKSKRSWNMSRIASKNTRPEKAVRALLHRMGFRFRLYRKDLPGCPDIVLPKHRTVIFVHGCFWHQHKGCRRCFMPSSNTEYWSAKLKNNVARDRENRKKLKRLGWRCIIIWECEISNLSSVRKKLRSLAAV